MVNILPMGEIGILDPRQGASTPRQGIPYRRGKQFKDVLRSNFYIVNKDIFGSRCLSPPLIKIKLVAASIFADFTNLNAI